MRLTVKKGILGLLAAWNLATLIDTKILMGRGESLDQALPFKTCNGLSKTASRAMGGNPTGDVVVGAVRITSCMGLLYGGFAGMGGGFVLQALQESGEQLTPKSP